MTMPELESRLFAVTSTFRGPEVAVRGLAGMSDSGVVQVVLV